MSIQPKWCELIASGKKTVEVRKTKPKLDTPFKVYIYCTNNGGSLHIGCGMYGEGLELFYHKSNIAKGDLSCVNGKVIGEFVCNCITSLKADNLIQSYYNNTQATCLTDSEIMRYANGGKLYYWHISDLVIYDKPKELNRFQKPCIRDCDCGGCKNAYYTRDYGFEGCALEEGLKRPPQSWCYVEELG